MENVMLEYAAMDRELNHYMRAIEETVNQVNASSTKVTRISPRLRTVFRQTHMLHQNNAPLGRSLTGIKHYSCQYSWWFSLLASTWCGTVGFQTPLAPVGIWDEWCSGNDCSGTVSLRSRGLRRYLLHILRERDSAS